jgi:tetratricopeptide (TPR) repeat protein
MIPAMQNLEPPDTHFVSAAVGWLELGSPQDARSELERVSAAAKNHPDVLGVQWLIHAEEKDWAGALNVAGALLTVVPDNANGWLHRAYALRRVKDGGLQAAWDALRPAYEKFPKESTIPYNLSCYACQMGKLEEAREWLQKALKTGDKDRIKRMALDDSDLEPLWEEIKRL